MKMPIETKPALWGMVGGAIGAAIIGFSWGDWAAAPGTNPADQVSAVAKACAQLLVGA
jgi:hypothetical protein